MTTKTSYLTERDAWLYLAVMIEQNEWISDGLCDEICWLEQEYKILASTRAAMISRIATEMSNTRGPDDLYLFPAGDWQPRIILARRFADECSTAVPNL